jgi:hypothetical protein
MYRYRCLCRKLSLKGCGTAADLSTSMRISNAEQGSFSQEEHRQLV